MGCLDEDAPGGYVRAFPRNAIRTNSKKKNQFIDFLDIHTQFMKQLSYIDSYKTNDVIKIYLVHTMQHQA